MAAPIYIAKMRH